MKPLVSLIIPVYNSEKYVEDTLNSLLSGTYDNIEIIVVDDGSYDNTATLVREIAKHDERVKYHYKSNSGPSSARNHGLSLARGNYVMFVDADDRLKPEALETILGVFDIYDCEVVSFDFETSDGSCRESIVTAPFPPSGLRTARDFLHLLYAGRTGNFIWSYCFKRELFSLKSYKFPDGINLMEDAVLVNQIARNVESVYMLDEPLYVYTVDEASLSRSPSIARLKEGMEALSLIENLNTGDPEDSMYHSYMFNMYMYIICSISHRIKDYRFGKRVYERLVKHNACISFNHKQRIKLLLLKMFYLH